MNEALKPRATSLRLQGAVNMLFPGLEHNLGDVEWDPEAACPGVLVQGVPTLRNLG